MLSPVKLCHAQSDLEKRSNITTTVVAIALTNQVVLVGTDTFVAVTSESGTDDEAAVPSCNVTELISDDPFREQSLITHTNSSADELFSVDLTSQDISLSTNQNQPESKTPGDNKSPELSSDEDIDTTRAVNYVPGKSKSLFQHSVMRM